MRVTILIGTAALLAMLPATLAQDANPGDPLIEATTGKLPDGLESLLQTAIEMNPDIRLADAELQRARAAHGQTRLKVAQTVAMLHYERQRLKKLRTDLARDLQRVLALQKNGVATAEEMRAVVLDQANADAKLAQVESELRYVVGLGGSAAPTSAPTRTPPKVAKPVPTLPRPQLEDAPEILAQLKKPVEVHWAETTIGDIALALQAATGAELPFVLGAGVSHDDYEIDLVLPGKPSILKVLDAIVDQTEGEICFVFRSYGVLVCERYRAVRMKSPSIPDMPIELD
jgi:hypothetical protein